MPDLQSWEPLYDEAAYQAAEAQRRVREKKQRGASHYANIKAHEDYERALLTASPDQGIGCLWP
jgi:hypothetical protein